MNFTAPEFLLLFLPAVLTAFALLRGGMHRQLFLVAASLLFYAQSGLQNLPLLLGSMAVNFAVGAWLVRPAAPKAARRLALWAAIVIDLGVLLSFKGLAVWRGEGEGFRTAADILIPLALSYVTFQQIGFVYACYSRHIRQLSLANYLFFVAFFPQLIIGPIVRYQDAHRQLAQGRLTVLSAENLAVGLAIFGFGLTKKVLLADPLFEPVDQVFVAAVVGHVATLDMWFAVVAFQLQLFLDFSAYADMAIGMARMFGIDLPVNFDQPLHARDRFDLWRRWHISFAVFMRSHVFRPLVRNWRVPAVPALAVTALLSGLWHGLGWTFVVWGLAQTALMLATHYRRKRFGGAVPTGRIAIVRAIAFTFLANCMLGAIFRTPTLDGMSNVFGQLFSWQAGYSLLNVRAWLSLVLCAFAVWIWPDTSRFFHRYWRAIDLRAVGERPATYARPSWIAFELTPFWALVGGVALFTCFMFLDRSGRFIYAQF